MAVLLSGKSLCGHASAAAGPGRHPEVASQGEFWKAGRAGRWPKVVSAWQRRNGLGETQDRGALAEPPARPTLLANSGCWEGLGYYGGGQGV
jgi:hypothetical protein